MSNPSTIVTGSMMPSHSGVSAVAFNASHDGSIRDGELPRVVKVTRLKGGVDVSSSATWSLSGGGVTATISSGAISITAFSSPCVLTATSVHEGISLTSHIDVQRVLDAPPSPPATGGTTTTLATTSTFALIQDAGTYQTVVAGPLTITAPTSPVYLIFTAPLTYRVHSTSTDLTGKSQLSGKWQSRNITANGSWTDVHAEIAAASWTQTSAAMNGIQSYDDGSIAVNYNAAAGAFTAGNTYEFRLMLRRSATGTGSSENSAQAPPFYVRSGSAIVKWSS